MEGYKDDVWDWYQIGGRWSQILAPQYDEFMKRSKDILNKSNGFLSQREVDKKQPELKNLWISLHGKGPNPLSNHYDLPDDGTSNDLLPLSDCLHKVEEWRKSDKERIESELKDAEEKWKDDNSMKGYCYKIAGSLLQEEFCFNQTVYNIDSYNYAIPENTENWWACVIDMHN